MKYMRMYFLQKLQRICDPLILLADYIPQRQECRCKDIELVRLTVAGQTSYLRYKEENFDQMSRGLWTLTRTRTTVNKILLQQQVLIFQERPHQYSTRGTRAFADEQIRRTTLFYLQRHLYHLFQSMRTSCLTLTPKQRSESI